jgi:hypothetical protein
MADLTDQQRADAEYVEGLYEPGRRLRLDLSDERQYRHAVDVHNLVGQTADKYPGLHRGLAEAREAHIAAGGPPPLDKPDDDGFETNGVIALVTTEQGTKNAAAEGASAILGCAYWLANALVVKDPNANLLASGAAEDYEGGGCLTVTTKAARAKPATSTMSSTLQYTYQVKKGDPPIVEYVHRPNVKLLAQVDPVVQAPKKIQTKVTTPYIRIGLGRGSGNSQDVDYWLWQTEANTTYAVPFIGSAEFEAEPASPVIGNVTVFGYLARAKGKPNPLEPGPAGGMIRLSQAAQNNILDNCQISGKKLTWTLPSGGQNKSDKGNPIVFASDSNWNTADTTLLTIQFSVNLVGKENPAMATVYSTSHPNNQLDGATPIPEIEYVFHCLAAGTQISLADGSTAAVEELTTENLVRGPGGSSLQVASTVLANHRGSVVKLTVDAERELLLSHNHLVLTPEGPRAAGKLTVGEEVCVEDGSAPLTAVAEEQYEGLLCNASLCLPDQTADPERNTMVANGIQVCDYEMQVQTQRAEREDPERILARLDEMYHPDFRSHQEAKAAQAAS